MPALESPWTQAGGFALALAMLSTLYLALATGRLYTRKAVDDLKQAHKERLDAANRREDRAWEAHQVAEERARVRDAQFDDLLKVNEFIRQVWEALAQLQQQQGKGSYERTRGTRP